MGFLAVAQESSRADRASDGEAEAALHARWEGAGRPHEFCLVKRSERSRRLNRSGEQQMPMSENLGRVGGHLGIPADTLAAAELILCMHPTRAASNLKKLQNIIVVLCRKSNLRILGKNYERSKSRRND